MHKISKTKDTIKSDLTVSMKTARIERQRVKMLKPQFTFWKEIQRKKTVSSWKNIQRCWC